MQNSLPDVLGSHADSPTVMQGSSHQRMCRPTWLQLLQIIPGSVVLHKLGTVAHQDEPRGFWLSGAFQTCGGAECLALQYSVLPQPYWLRVPYYLHSLRCLGMCLFQNSMCILLAGSWNSCFCLVTNSQHSVNESHGFNSSGIFPSTSILLLNASSLCTVDSWLSRG